MAAPVVAAAPVVLPPAVAALVTEHPSLEELARRFAAALQQAEEAARDAPVELPEEAEELEELQRAADNLRLGSLDDRLQVFLDDGYLVEHLGEEELDAEEQRFIHLSVLAPSPHLAQVLFTLCYDHVNAAAEAEEMSAPEEAPELAPFRPFLELGAQLFLKAARLA
jgi:hypothetical protein